MYYKIIYSKENVRTNGPYVMAECLTDLDFFDFEDENWKDGNVDLLKFKIDDKLIPDFIFNDLNLRIISNNFKDLLDKLHSSKNLIFFPVELYKSNILKTGYWLVLFKKLQGIVDQEKSTYSAGELMYPMFTDNSPKDEVFNYNGGMNDWYVHNDLLKKIKNQNLEGVDFRKLK